MKRVLLCLLAFSSLAALAAGKKAKSPPEPREIWSLEFPGERPAAAFFDAASSALYVSVAGKEGARVDRVSLEGKLVKSGVMKGKGAPGPLRAFDGRLYWIVGDQVQTYSEEGALSAGRIPVELGEPRDIAVGRNGLIYVGTSDGSLYRVPGAGATAPRGVEHKGQPITGLFLLQDTLYILRGERLQSVTLAADVEPTSEVTPLCPKNPCRGLEHMSNGDWLTTQGKSVLEVNATRARVLLRAAELPGRPAYVYRRDPSEDFFVLPLPGVIRAYRAAPPGKVSIKQQNAVEENAPGGKAQGPLDES